MRTGGPPSGLRLGTIVIVLTFALSGLIVSSATNIVQTQPGVVPVGWAAGAQENLAALSFSGAPDVWTSAGHSPPRYYSPMAYDSQSDRVILFGGNVGGALRNDTWAYDVNSNTWTNMNPAVHPPARSAHSMAYDAQSDRVILFGGRGIAAGSLNDTWAYDFNTNRWTNVSAAIAPSARDYAAMAYDRQSDRVILFGGDRKAGLSNDTWAYDFDTNMWTNKTSSTHPSARGEGAMAYDSQSDRVILFGNDNGVADTWAYDFNSNMWTNMSTANPPSARADLAMAYDLQSDRVILFGGLGVGGGRNDTWAYDFNTNTWTNLDPGTKPPPREYQSMAYDSRSDQTVMFGGGDTTITGVLRNDTWTYDFNTNAWTNMSSVTAPSARVYHSMAYDSAADRIVLFGGGDATFLTLQNDTWSYDLNSNVWTELKPSTAPPARDGAATVYDVAADRILLFGGLTATAYANDTWSYNFATNMWTNVTPAGSPPARGWGGMAYDSAADRIVLFGGSNSISYLNDTWTYSFSGGTWTNVTPVVAPSARGDPSMTYDASADRFIVFGGTDMAVGHPIDTWSYDLGTNMWTDVNPGYDAYRTVPPGRAGHTMAYDSVADRTLLFGGYSLGLLNDTWALELKAKSWTNINRTSRPPARVASAMAYDASADRFVLFGGNTATGPLGDTWSYDLAGYTWTNVSPALGPRGRYGFAMVYEAAADRFVLFGGAGTSGYLGETWSYDLTTDSWMNLTRPGFGPSGRQHHSMAYDAVANRAVLFGGTSSTYLGDTWSYDLANNTWTYLSPNGVVPSRREGHSMAYDPATNRIVLFGGVTTTGWLNDMWSYELSTNTWTNLGAAPLSGRSGFGMAFDSAADRFVLFGGRTATGYADDTWFYDLPTNTWTNLSPVVAPSARQGFGMAYDPVADRTVVFAGSSPSALLGDTWWYEAPQNASAPQSLQAFVGDRHVNLSWLAPPSDGGSPVTGYRVYRGTSSGGESHLADVASVLQYRDTGLTNGVTYYYEVSAVNMIGEGPRSTELAATPFAGGAPPTAPRSLQVTVGNANLVLTWQSPSSDGGSPVTGYRLYRGLSSTGESLLVTLGNVLTYTDTGLTNGVTYYYEVSAINAVGEGPRSNEVSAFPTPLVLSITATPQTGPVPLNVSFTISVAGGTAPYGFVWSFGDGASSTQQNPVHEFVVQGNYTVSVFASDSAGAARIGTVLVNLTPALASTASADVVTGPVPLTVHFTGSASGGTPPYTFHWDFGDGMASDAQDASHTYAAPGDFLANLTVRDASGHAVTKSLAIKANVSVGVSPSGFPYWILFLAIAIAVALLAFLFLWRRRKRPEAGPPPPAGLETGSVTEAPPADAGTDRNRSP